MIFMKDVHGQVMWTRGLLNIMFHDEKKSEMIRETMTEQPDFGFIDSLNDSMLRTVAKKLLAAVHDIPPDIPLPAAILGSLFPGTKIR